MISKRFTFGLLFIMIAVFVVSPGMAQEEPEGDSGGRQAGAHSTLGEPVETEARRY